MDENSRKLLFCILPHLSSYQYLPFYCRFLLTIYLFCLLNYLLFPTHCITAFSHVHIMSFYCTSPTIYIIPSGNAASLAWRVDWQAGKWTEAFGKDTADQSAPHVDCRRYFWEPKTSSLILLSDGGVWLREEPAKRGTGVWRSLNGDTGAMEFVSAHWYGAVCRHSTSVVNDFVGNTLLQN